MPPVHFRGTHYYDDRLFVMLLSRCDVTLNADGTQTTTVYHESPPHNCKWCIVTYKNTANYPAVRVDAFDSFDEARTYLERIEPTVPLVSLDGNAQSPPLNYRAFAAWKRLNGLEDFDYAQVKDPGGTNPKEIITTMPRPHDN